MSLVPLEDPDAVQHPDDAPEGWTTPRQTVQDIKTASSRDLEQTVLWVEHYGIGLGDKPSPTVYFFGSSLHEITSPTTLYDIICVLKEEKMAGLTLGKSSACY